MQYERYQPSFERVLNEELPDVSDPADGRFWKAGVAQGLTTNPYEKRLVISGEVAASQRRRDAASRAIFASCPSSCLSNQLVKTPLVAARRKPIVLGPRTASVVVDGETHTLANAVRDVAWIQ